MVEARPQSTYQVEPDFAARQSILWAVSWLVGGVTITLLASLVFLRPSVVAAYPFLSYGRLRGIADTTITFGWLAMIGFAALYTVLPRITEVQLHNEVLGAATSLGWSFILTGGIVALLLGVNQGRPLAELGMGADIGLAAMLLFVAYNGLVTVTRRRERTLYVSGWYLLAVAALAPIVFVLGNITAFRGVTDVVVNGFYLNGIEMLWFLPVALAVAHYVIPVETGNPLFSAATARTGFWSLVFAGGWAGQRFYLKGPEPLYLDAIAVAMTIVLLVPALSSAVNLFASGRGRWDRLTQSYGLRFAAAGLGLMVAWIALVVLGAMPSVWRYVGLTSWQGAVRHLGVFGVFSSFGFALVYHAYPLMVGRDWYSRPLASIHFWATEIGVVTGCALLVATGAAQSAAQSASTTVTAVPGIVTLLRILSVATFAVVAAAQYALAYNMFRTSRAGPIFSAVQPSTAVAGVRG